MALYLDNESDTEYILWVRARRRTVGPAVAKNAQHSENVRKQSAPDRRVERTRKALRAALHSLVAHKSYDEITLSEVLTRANVGRSTFYLHFRDKDDLLLSTVADVMTVAGVAPTAEKWPDSVLWFSLPMFDYHAQQKRSASHRMGERGKNILHAHLQRAICDLIEAPVRREFRNADLVQPFIASSFIFVLNWWLQGNGSMAPAAADAAFRKLVVPGLLAFRGQVEEID